MYLIILPQSANCLIIIYLIIYVNPLSGKVGYIVVPNIILKVFNLKDRFAQSVKMTYLIFEIELTREAQMAKR